MNSGTVLTLYPSSKWILYKYFASISSSLFLLEMFQRQSILHQIFQLKSYEISKKKAIFGKYHRFWELYPMHANIMFQVTDFPQGVVGTLESLTYKRFRSLFYSDC